MNDDKENYCDEKHKRYSVKTRFIFEGFFVVKAKNKIQAREYVEQHCGLVIGGDIHSSLSSDDVDWDFFVHPKKVIGRTYLREE
jgi:hypothetical protein